MRPKDESIRSKSKTVLEVPLCLGLVNTPRPWGRAHLTGATGVATTQVWMSFENQNTSNCSLRASGQHRELCEVVGLSSEVWECEVVDG